MAEDEKETIIEGAADQLIDIARSEDEQQKFESDFAIKMVDALVSFNSQQMSISELPNRFFTTDELSCFGLFAKSVPVNPLPAIYPENGFLLFRGVPVPTALNLTTANLEEIHHILSALNSIDLNSLHLSEFAPDMINAYQIATQIYNDRLDKARASYFANVKDAKTQVVEVSAALVCGFVIILTLASLI